MSVAAPTVPPAASPPSEVAQALAGALAREEEPVPTAAEIVDPETGTYDWAAFERLGDRIAQTWAHLTAGTHRFLCYVRVFEEARGAAVLSFRSTARWLSWRVGIHIKVAEEYVRVANALPAWPKIDEALRTGRISYCKARAITRIAGVVQERATAHERAAAGEDPVDGVLPTGKPPDLEAVEETLLSYARNGSGAVLERICRLYRRCETLAQAAHQERRERRRVTWRDRPDGLVRIQADLLPEEAALVRKAIDVMRREEVGLSDAELTELAEGIAAEGRAPRPFPSAEGKGDGDAGTCADGDPAAAAGPEAGPAEGEAPAVPSAEGTTDGAATSAEPAQARQRPWPSQADALVACARHALDCARRGSTRLGAYEVVLHVDADGLSGRAAARRCELETGWPVADETARRLACDAGVVEVLERSDGAVLDVGRKRRTVPHAMRRALAVRDEERCQFPGCPARRYLHAHHLRHWAQGGETKLDNLCLLCSWHHAKVHEDGWSVRAGDDGRLRFFDPRGRELERAPKLSPVEDDGFLTLVARQLRRGLRVDGKELRAQDPALGEGVDYRWAILMLAERAGL